MSTEPKLKSKKDIATLKKCYINKKMSTTEIEKESKKTIIKRKVIRSVRLSLLLK